MAQESVGDAYGGGGNNANRVLGEVLEVNQTPSAQAPSQAPTEAAPRPAAAPVASSGSLPFTGFDAFLMAAGGILLVGLGLTVRRVSRGSTGTA